MYKYPFIDFCVARVCGLLNTNLYLAAFYLWRYLSDSTNTAQPRLPPNKSVFHYLKIVAE